MFLLLTILYFIKIILPAKQWINPSFEEIEMKLIENIQIILCYFPLYMLPIFAKK